MCILDEVHISTSALVIQARLWACGRGDVSTPSFGSHPNPISTRGQIMPTLYWCPHQVLKATGAPAYVYHQVPTTMFDKIDSIDIYFALQARLWLSKLGVDTSIG